MNKKIILSLALLGLVSGCSTTNTDGWGNLEINKQQRKMSQAEALADSLNTKYKALDQHAVFFDVGSDKVKPEFATVIQTHHAEIQLHPELELQIIGHADERGKPEYNKVLGEERAEATATKLKERGTTYSQIDVQSMGEEQPLSFGKTKKSYSLNRRAEIIYIPKKVYED